MKFASDNSSGIAPAILDAIVRVNSGNALGYGNDELTKRVEKRLNDLFEREVASFLVPTGTGANALAIAQFAPPWGAVFCHAQAHIANDEAGAPEFFGGGLKLITIHTDDGKITPAAFDDGLNAQEWRVPHSVMPAVLSLSQAAETGVVYSVTEIKALAEMAHARGMVLHMDGARFANAVAHLNVSAAETSWKAGVDVLSFGATKAGAMAAEAVIIFDAARAEGMALRRKRGGHLISKHRFLAAQFDAFLDDELWLKLARHSNRAATRLAAALEKAGARPVWPVQANEIFVAVSPAADRALKEAGAQYYAWGSRGIAARIDKPQDHLLLRLVMSFNTTDAEVDQFASIVAASS
jgi:threonine aldolase